MTNKKMLTESQFKEIKKGDRFMVFDLDGKTMKCEVAEENSYWNPDCEGPGLEVVAEGGFTYCFGDVYEFVEDNAPNPTIWRAEFTWNDVLHELPGDLPEFFRTLDAAEQQDFIARYSRTIENGLQAGLMENAGAQVMTEAVWCSGLAEELKKRMIAKKTELDGLTDKLNQVIDDDAAAELLADVFHDEMSSDDENPSRIMVRIASRYLGASKPERALIDEIFSTICGWEFKTLVNDRAGIRPSKEMEMKAYSEAYWAEVQRHERKGRPEADTQLHAASVNLIRQYESLYPNAVLVKAEPFKIMSIPETICNYEATYIVAADPGDYPAIEEIVKEGYTNPSMSSLSRMEKKLSPYNPHGLVWS